MHALPAGKAGRVFGPHSRQQGRAGRDAGPSGAVISKPSAWPVGRAFVISRTGRAGGGQWGGRRKFPEWLPVEGVCPGTQGRAGLPVDKTGSESPVPARVPAGRIRKQQTGLMCSRGRNLSASHPLRHFKDTGRQGKSQSAVSFRSGCRKFCCCGLELCDRFRIDSPLRFFALTVKRCPKRKHTKELPNGSK
jgi:hypothetical protein